MFSRTNDPRFRRTLNNLSQNIEAANESAQQGIFTFGQNYVNPCVSSISECVHSCTGTCFPGREERLRRIRNRGRGNPELNFDFYDDWDDDEDLGWGNDELDRLLTGSVGYSTVTAQPNRPRGMAYSNRRDKARRKSGVQTHESGQDPTVIPSSSYFGFLGRLPWNLGNKELRYRPSAADLQEHPGSLRRAFEEEEQPLIEESEEEEHIPNGKSKHMRQRSHTNASGHTTDSFSSRGDIFPSEDELDDAVPIDDEFAMALERRYAGSGEDLSSGRTRSKGPGGSRLSTRSVSSRSIQDTLKKRSDEAPYDLTDPDQHEAAVPTLSELRLEEQLAEEEEEADVQRRRRAARQLALERGLKDAHLQQVCFAHLLYSIQSFFETRR